MKKLVAMIMVVLAVISLAGAHAEASDASITAAISSTNVLYAFHAFERSVSENMTSAHISSMGPGSIAINFSGMGESDNNDIYNLFADNRR